jgi:aquaporin NIP
LGSPWQSFALEALLTGILMFVILGVSTGSKDVGMMAGIAIGGVIGLEALFAGPICGASMNPARSLAPALMSGHLASLWVYVTAPFLGSIVAVPLWMATRPNSRNSGPIEQPKPQEVTA